MRRSMRIASCICLCLGFTSASWSAKAADPTTAQCLAASESSLALRNQHKLRDARAQLLICSAASCPEEIRDECVHRMGEIKTAMPTIVFEFKDAAGNDLDDVKVTVDGQLGGNRLGGAALAADPGEHTFVFETVGQPAVKKRYVLREGEKDRRERVTFGSAVATVPPAAAAVAAPPASIIAQSPGAPPSAGGSSGGLATQRIAAIVAASVGVVGLGVGIGFGLDSMSKHDSAKAACPDNPCATKAGVTLWSDAVSAGNYSTAGFIVGAVGLAGGAALWLTGKPASEADEKAGTQIGLGLGSFQLKGVW